MFDMVCAVDGAWGLDSSRRKIGGGIGGKIKVRSCVILHIFTGPVEVGTSDAAEIEAIIYVLRLVLVGKFGKK